MSAAAVRTPAKDLARPDLSAASDEALVSALTTLTHRIHSRRGDGDRADDLREQRMLVEDEVLRRMGGHR